MNDQDLLNRLTRILRDLLTDDSIVLTMDTRRDEVRNWDSFAYVNFIVAVEMEFGIKFKVADVESFQNVGAVVRAIGGNLGRAAASGH
jgi:acyl carrier protein